LAHATMEPMNAAAEVTNDRVDVWSPNQAPTLIRNAAADVAGISRDNVFVHTTKYLGGGFGRRSTLDYSLEAVELAKELKQPVKVMWSREEDMQHSPIRPITRHKLRGLVKDGELLAWEHRIAGESIMQQTLSRWLPLMIPGWVPKFLRSGIGDVGSGAMEMMNKHMTTAEGAKFDYEIPHMKVSLREGGVNLPIHFWRSVGHSFNGFVTETFMDEMSYRAHKDPIENRKNLLKKNKRAQAVLDEVKKISKWDKPIPKGRARGVAYHFSFASHVAEVAEVELVDNQIKVHKVYCAVDCGIAVNPDIVKDQIKSGVIYGMSAALNSEITIDKGAIQQSNFHDYAVVRMNEAPDIEVSIINSTESPTGVGEPGLPPIAPAIGNAVYALTGKRLRSLPLRV
ncbi:MAG: xanthine dehydrogenase family protein molybdopterin-binding subunit, partial [Bdellovibrionales bacterium]|nr:molybdopterin-dependent oxidoreductase [Bdellovibrionales bacterium]NQZ19412.1 xanthine dehydrogenase family protein molybdopterin-binding subunit [Bdellovibrionales bacterium]